MNAGPPLTEFASWEVDAHERPRVTGLGVAVVAGIGISVATWLALLVIGFAADPFAVVTSLGLGIYVVAGSVLVTRRPRNIIGWLLLAIALSFELQSLPQAATAAQFASGRASFAAVVDAWLANWTFGLLIATYAVLAIVFPAGRLPAGRWGTVSRVFIGLVPIAVGLAIVAPTITADSLDGTYVTIASPFAVTPGWPLWGAAAAAADVFVYGGFLVALGSMVVRLRRAGGVERQQLKWVVAAIAAIAAALPIGLVSGTFLPVLAAYVLPPIAIGIAVLRYRLYDIDLIINRTIVYGLATAILAGGYAALVSLMQRIFFAVTGSTSDAAIILTTLVVVSLFTPVKNRLQTLVDRRLGERDPAKPLLAFIDAVESRLSPMDPETALRRLLQVSIGALDASAGFVRLGELEVARIERTEQASAARYLARPSGDLEASLNVARPSGRGEVALTLARRTRGRPFGERDRTVLEAAVAAVAAALTVDHSRAPLNVRRRPPTGLPMRAGAPDQPAHATE